MASEETLRRREGASLPHPDTSGWEDEVDGKITSEHRSQSAAVEAGRNQALEHETEAFGDASKQNLTISLSRQTIRKAKVLAARRATSISALVAEQIEILVGEDEAYERAQRQALKLLEQGFHLGAVIRVSRDELHER